MIFKIFKIRRTVRDAQKITEDPLGAAGGMLTGMFKGWVLLGYLAVVVVLVILGLLGFGGLLGGPFGFARVLFYLIVIFVGIPSIVAIVVWRNIKRRLRKAKGDLYRTAGNNLNEPTIEAEIVDEE